MNATNVNPEVLLALTKVKADREAVAPGEYRGTTVLKVSYDLKVGADYQSEIAAAVPWMQVAAVLFSKLNDVTIESVVAEALALDEEQATVVKDQANAAVRKLVAATKRDCSGKVTGATFVEVVS